MWSKIIRDEKAQASSAEFLIGYLIFFLILTMAITLWVGTSTKIERSERLYDFEEVAAETAEKLVRTRGVPSEWGRENVTVIGLAGEPRMLEKSKIIEFVRIMNDSSDAIHLNGNCDGISNYECNKERLGIGRFNFYFILKNVTGGIEYVDGIPCAAGRPLANETQLVTITRTALIGGNITRMDLTVWSDREESL
jgi:hypothetical protein